MCEGYSYRTSHIDGFEYRGFSKYSDMLSDILYGDFEVLISWGSIDRPIHNLLLSHKSRIPPVILQFAGGPHEGDELSLFSYIVTQNPCDRDEFLVEGYKATSIFGVDKEFWKPDPVQPKNIEVLYPASFCQHKCNERVAEEHAENAVLVGKWDDLSLVDYCKSWGATVLPPVTHHVLRELYRASKLVVIPALAGSQRTIAEARACGVEVKLTNELNHKCREVIDGKAVVLGIKEMANEYLKIIKKVLGDA